MPVVPPLARNLAIVVGIALVLTLLFGSDSGKLFSFLFLVMNIAFAVGLCFVGYRIWRTNRGTFDLMPAQRRWALYGATALLALVLLTSWFWVTTSATSLLFFALVGGLGFAIWRLWQESRRYYY